MALFDNALSRLLQTQFPLWQAPLPFEAFTPTYSGRIRQAGALGMLRVGESENKAHLEAAMQTCREQHPDLTLCFFHRLPHHQRSDFIGEEHRHMVREELHLDPAIACPDNFDDLLESAISAQPRMIGFACGIPEKEIVSLIREQKILTFAICRSLLEALAAADYGIDILVLQGNEAGGERCGFENRLPVLDQSALSLLQQVRGQLDLPIVLWGDFIHGADVVSAMAAGAQAVMVDRPLLACAESELSPEQIERLHQASEYESVRNTHFSIRPMRHLAPANGLPIELPANLRELLTHAYFCQHREDLPLPVSATPGNWPATLADLLVAFDQQVHQLLG